LSLSYYSVHTALHSFPTRRSSDLLADFGVGYALAAVTSRQIFFTRILRPSGLHRMLALDRSAPPALHHSAQQPHLAKCRVTRNRSEEHTSELQSPYDLVCRLLLEK